MIIAIAIPVLLFLLWVLSGYLPTRDIATPAYRSVATTPQYEIRAYPSYVVAETSRASGDGSSGFRELFQYISGSNTGQSKIAMTAPVLKSGGEAGRKLAMTSPVLVNGAAGTIAFIMPPGSRLAELPKPKSPKITLREIPGHQVAAVKFSGFAGPRVLREKTEQLLKDLQHDGVQICSPPTTALYNPPWTPPFMRRNEILVQIEPGSRAVPR